MPHVRFTKDGISVGTHTHKAGDVAFVPDRRADAMLRYGEAVLVPGPAEAPPIEQATANPTHAQRATAPRQK